MPDPAGWDAHGPKGNRNPSRRGLDKEIARRAAENAPPAPPPRRRSGCPFSLLLPLAVVAGLVTVAFHLFA